MGFQRTIRVLIIDADSWSRSVLARELRKSGDIRVIGFATDAPDVRDQILRHHPDVLLIDPDLGRENGLDLLAKLREHYPVPVIALGSGGRGAGALVVKATELGALDVVDKSRGATSAGLHALVRELTEKIRIAALEARPAPSPALATELVSRAPSFRSLGLDPARFIVAIGASTGGTEALRSLLARVPGDFPPVVVVQHMPAGFTRSFAERLDRFSAARVSEAEEAERLTPGRAVVARGDTHLVVRRSGRAWSVHYTHQRPVNRHCPSVDELFDSVTAAAGRFGVGVLLTGMGEDGARGLLRMRQAGALTVAQDRSSCVVYGMPKAAVDLDAVVFGSPPEDLPDQIGRHMARKFARPAATAGRARR